MNRVFILVQEDDLTEVNSYLTKGYRVEAMSACACQGSCSPHPYCYVYLTKE